MPSEGTSPYPQAEEESSDKMFIGSWERNVSRAFFHAPVQHEIYVELCEEAKKKVEDADMCAKLRMSMYGTKAAAQNWQKVQETMAELGFLIGKATPVLFYHTQRSLRCLVRGGDFVVSGEPVDLAE